MRAQVGIVGAGPAGLTLARLLARYGIESVVLENKSRDYVEHRTRAGALERGSIELLEEAGVCERLKREGLVHHEIALQFDGERHRVALSELAGGASIVVYGPTEVVKDLASARLAAQPPLLFEVEEVALADIDSDRPRVQFHHGGRPHELECDVVAGCDGFQVPAPPRRNNCRRNSPGGVAGSVLSARCPGAGMVVLPVDAPDRVCAGGRSG